MSCEFHLRNAFKPTAASFNAVLKQYWLNLLFCWIFWCCCGLCFWWLVQKIEFFCVNVLSVCSIVAGWSWICNAGYRGSWPQRICAITCFRASVSVSFGLASSHQQVEFCQLCSLSGEGTDQKEWVGHCSVFDAFHLEHQGNPSVFSSIQIEIAFCQVYFPEFDIFHLLKEKITEFSYWMTNLFWFVSWSCDFEDLQLPLFRNCIFELRGHQTPCTVLVRKGPNLAWEEFLHTRKVKWCFKVNPKAANWYLFMQKTRMLQNPSLESLLKRDKKHLSTC